MKYRRAFQKSLPGANAFGFEQIYILESAPGAVIPRTLPQRGFSMILRGRVLWVLREATPGLCLTDLESGLQNAGTVAPGKDS